MDNQMYKLNLTSISISEILEALEQSRDAWMIGMNPNRKPFSQQVITQIKEQTKKQNGETKL